jgi:hypothetical protein
MYHVNQVRDYLVRMLNKLFSVEKNRAADPDSKASSSSAADKPKKERKEKSSRSDRAADDDRGAGGGRRGGRIQVSQVKLLAEHCYSMTDEQIEEMVSAKIPTHSRWESYQEFKDKINRRDELIR